jgi:hypothetical protein
MKKKARLHGKLNLEMVVRRTSYVSSEFKKKWLKKGGPVEAMKIQ